MISRTWTQSSAFVGVVGVVVGWVVGWVGRWKYEQICRKKCMCATRRVVREVL